MLQQVAVQRPAGDETRVAVLQPLQRGFGCLGLLHRRRERHAAVLGPGRGAGGDLPPRPECAPLWMDALLAKLPRVELTLLVGLHAQRRFL
ncbi:MAG TPA: hypothetical protein PLB41_03620, partial [Rubrivivax sp.]|nr:hypothetical protein [Rubrivivax sp.]